MTCLNISSINLKLMPKHTLFVCQSYHSSEERPEHQPADSPHSTQDARSIAHSPATIASVSLSFRQLVWIKAVRSQKILKLRSPSLFGCGCSSAGKYRQGGLNQLLAPHSGRGRKRHIAEAADQRLQAQLQ
jgi:hypothetical protein